MEKADQLLQGSIDMHAHGYPQFTLKMPPRVTDYEWAQAALSAGMAGFVIKGHVWPTTNEAYTLNKMVDGIQIFGSITLNSVVGGINPLAVQIAAESGAKVVFMPTWSSKNDIAKRAYHTRMLPYLPTLETEIANKPGLSVIDRQGELIPEAYEIIKICKNYNLVLASGHLPIEESIKLCRAATLEGVKFVLSHPLASPLIGATLEQQKEIAQMGGFVEHVFINCMPMHLRLDPRRIVEAIEFVGPEHTIMSSDAIEGWNPTPPEVMRMYIGSLLDMGVSDEAIYMMSHTNPGHLLNIEFDKIDI